MLHVGRIALRCGYVGERTKDQNEYSRLFQHRSGMKSTKISKLFQMFSSLDDYMLNMQTIRPYSLYGGKSVLKKLSISILCCLGK
jgi:hypothetical protein